VRDAGAGSGLLADPAVRRYLFSSALSGSGIALMLAWLFEQAFELTGDAP